MTRYFNMILSVALIGFALMMGMMINCHKSVDYRYVQTDGNHVSEIVDGQRSDVMSYIEASGSGMTTLPEIIDSMPSPSVRLLTSQK